QSASEENVVAQDKDSWIPRKVLRSNDEGLRNPLRGRLNRIAKAHAKLVAIAENTFEGMLVDWGGDDEDLANPRQHQHRKRIVDQRLVVYWQQLFGGRQGDRV